MEKNKLKGATFGQAGGKEHQKALRKKNKEIDKMAREKERFDRENPKPENALSYLESLIQNIPKPKTPVTFLGINGKKKKRTKKKDERTVEELDGSEKTTDEIELDGVLKEVEEEAKLDMVTAEEPGAGEDKKEQRRSSFFSPISMSIGRRKTEECVVAGQGVIRASIQRELFRKIATTLSPFKRKTKKEAKSETKTGSHGEDVVLPEIISPKAAMKREEGLEHIDGGEGDDTEEGKEMPKPKRRRKKKKRKKVDGVEGGGESAIGIM